MTDTMKTEQRREAFETWMRDKHPSHSLNWRREANRGDGAYLNSGAHHKWLGWCAALDSQAAQAQPETAFDKFNKNAADLEGENPIERLRYFLSHALSPQDWLDVEPFLEAAQAQALSDEKLLDLFRQSFPKTKFSSAYRQFARDVEAAASPSHSKEPGDMQSKSQESMQVNGDVHSNAGLSELCSRLRLLEEDHGPDGWPAVQMRDISALLDAMEGLKR